MLVPVGANTSVLSRAAACLRTVLLATQALLTTTYPDRSPCELSPLCRPVEEGGAGAIASAEVATFSAKLAMAINRDVTPNTLRVFLTFLP